jgi:hypothetical protein
MIALNEVEPTKPARPRAPRKRGDQASANAPGAVAKSKDAGKTKVSFYLDTPTAKKLSVEAIIRGVDQSDVANEILARALSSVTFYNQVRGGARPLDTGEDRQDEEAA